MLHQRQCVRTAAVVDVPNFPGRSPGVFRKKGRTTQGEEEEACLAGVWVSGCVWVGA